MLVIIKLIRNSFVH